MKTFTRSECAADKTPFDGLTERTAARIFFALVKVPDIDTLHVEYSPLLARLDIKPSCSGGRTLSQAEASLYAEAVAGFLPTVDLVVLERAVVPS